MSDTQWDNTVENQKILNIYQRKENDEVSAEYNINRLEYIILRNLYSNDCKDYFNSCTITELMEETNGALATRMTVYKKLQKLVKNGYVSKGVTDDHADTYFILEKGVNLIEGGSKSE